jgi:hypothetical protein
MDEDDNANRHEMIDPLIRDRGINRDLEFIRSLETSDKTRLRGLLEHGEEETTIDIE